MRMTPQLLAALAVVALALLATVWYLWPGGGGYDTADEQQWFSAGRGEAVIPAGLATEPVVPAMAVPREFNPFSLQTEVSTIAAEDLPPPPPPPLALPDLKPLPLLPR